MTQLPRSLLQTWQALPNGRRVLFAGLAGALVAVGVLLYSWSSTTNYVPLYSGLDDQDSGPIIAELRSQGVPFKLEAGGGTVLVPQAQVDELRVGFASQGMPQGGNVGFELVKSNGFSATDFVQRLNFQRGLQGELARTIESFSAVDRARVHIVLPEKSLFVKDQRPPSASVVLQLRGGQRLAPNEVRGIAHLVAGAVEGLKQEQITIVETDGATLFDGSQLAQDGGFGASGSQLELQRAYEQTLATDAQEMLDRTLGAGRATITVRAVLNFDRLETMTESYTPGVAGTAVPRSSTAIEETYTTAAGAAGAAAVPGAAANVPGANQALAANAAGGGDGTDYKRTETTTNFEVGKTLTKNVQAVGGVKKLSVSLLLDDRVAEAQVQPLEAAVSAAVGLDKERGDAVAVSRFAFDRSQIEEADKAFAAEASRDQLLGYVRMALPVIALVIGFVLLKLLLKSAGSRGAYRALAVQPALGAGGTAAAGLPSGAAALRALPPPPIDEARSEIEERVSELVARQPDMVAEVMQSWLREDPR